MFYQTFRPIDGVLSSYGRRTESLPKAIERAKQTRGAEVRIWGTLQVVWALGTTMDEPDPVHPWWHSTKRIPAAAAAPKPVQQQPARWPPAKVHTVGTCYASSTIRSYRRAEK